MAPTAAPVDSTGDGAGRHLPADVGGGPDPGGAQLGKEHGPGQGATHGRLDRAEGHPTEGVEDLADSEVEGGHRQVGDAMDDVAEGAHEAALLLVGLGLAQGHVLGQRIVGGDAGPGQRDDRPR